MVKVGVIGCGKIAITRHLPEYASNPDVEIAGVYDFNLERAKEVAEQYQTRAYESVEEMLNDPQIEAVSVCVRNSDHSKVTVDALRAGKHVLCEKPMAVSLDECKEMVKTAEKTGKKLMIGHNQRFNRTHMKAKELIKNGAIGKVLSFKTTFGHGGPETWTVDKKNVWFFDKRFSAFGAMADLGVHKTDLLIFLLETKVKKVTAVLKTLDKKDAEGNLINVDDNAICIYEMENGAVGTMTASWTYYGEEDNSTIIYGSEGILKIYDNPNYSIVRIGKDGTKIYYELDKMQTNDNQTKSGIIDSWVAAIKNDTVPEVNGKDALDAMKAIFAALESSESGQTVEITEED